MFDYEDDPVWLYAAWEFALEDDKEMPTPVISHGFIRSGRGSLEKRGVSSTSATGISSFSVHS